MYALITSATASSRGTLSFYFGPTHLGLLYYWTKYVKRKVSLLQAYGKLETWLPNDPDEDDDANVESESAKNNGVDRGPVLVNTEPWPIPYVHNRVHCWRKVRCASGARADFAHFMGYSKPWNHTLPDLSESTRLNSPLYFWHYTLRELNANLDGRINISALGAERVMPPIYGQNVESDTITNLLN